MPGDRKFDENLHMFFVKSDLVLGEFYMTALERVRRAEKLPGDYQEDRIHKMACVGRPWSKFDGRSGGGAGTFFF